MSAGSTARRTTRMEGMEQKRDTWASKVLNPDREERNPLDDL
jgi:hypothetical protein